MQRPIALTLLLCAALARPAAGADHRFALVHHAKYIAASTDLCGPVVQDYALGDYVFASGYYTFSKYKTNGYSEIWSLDANGQEQYRIDTYSIYYFHVDSNGKAVLTASVVKPGSGGASTIEVDLIDPMIRIKAFPEPHLLLVEVDVETEIRFYNTTCWVSIPDIVTVNETPGGSYAEVSVRLSQRRSEVVAVLVQGRGSGSAAEYADFGPALGPLEFIPGEIEKTARFSVYDDNLDESDEYFDVLILNAAAPHEGVVVNSERDSTAVRILDDDALPLFSIDDVAAGEGDSGATPLTFTVTKTGGTERTATVNYAVLPGTALSGEDYQAHVGGTLTFASYDSEKTVVVNALGDGLAESDEWFTVRLSNPVNAALAVEQARGTIVNDDVPTLTVADISVEEGDALGRFAVFRALLSSPAIEKVTFYYETVAGTALPGSDYVHLDRRAAEIAVGESVVDLPVPLWADEVHESGECFYLDLSGAQNATLATTRATAAIIDDDDASLPVMVQHFSAVYRQGTVQLAWETASEMDHVGFVLERAVGCVETRVIASLRWEVIASYETHSDLQSQGNSSERHEYTFVDKAVEAGEGYVYRLSDLNVAGEAHRYGEAEITLPDAPGETALAAPFPNPFNPQTRIRYGLAASGRVEVVVYDLLGRKVKTLMDGAQSAGSYNLYWHGEDASGHKVATGAYVIVFKAGGVIRTQKVVLTK